jgi:hypothetical protein
MAIKRLAMGLSIERYCAHRSLDFSGLLAVESVIGELVSAMHFPASRENTGKSWRLRRVMAMQLYRSRTDSGLPSGHFAAQSAKFPVPILRERPETDFLKTEAVRTHREVVDLVIRELSNVEALDTKKQLGH